MADEMETLGLSGRPMSDWPRVTDTGRRPIDVLKPDSKEHGRVLEYLLKRLNSSERVMTRFHGRWNINEKKIQAFISLPDREKALKEISDRGLPPQARPIVVPYMMATVATIVTYLVNVFLGRKPYFPIGSRGDNVQAGLFMEQVLQYQADHTKLGYQLFRYLLDGEIYGLGVMRVFWTDVEQMRTVWRASDSFGPLGALLGQRRVSTKERRLVYQGVDIESVDPFLFFPDPSVPMAEVNRKGEYVFFRSFHGYHILKKMEAAGEIMYVDDTPRRRPTVGDQLNEGGDSVRGLLAFGDSLTTGGSLSDLQAPANTYQVDQGSVEIIPRELGLGDSEVPEKWIFSILNKSQIVQAEPWGADHDQHPVVVSEPYSFGYGFGQPGITDWIGPIQDSVSWFLNSHMQNVREAINNIFVYDPNFIEEQDFKNPGPGLRIRMKPSALGMDLNKVFQQVPVADVTKGHIDNMELYIRIGDALSAVNENLRGQPQQGGRKTATEVITSSESGTSRLASHARFISAQSITDLTEQMSLLTQQYLTEPMYLNMVGQLAQLGQSAIQVTPEMLVGDFYYPPSDGTVPINRVGLFEIWQQLLQVLFADQEMRMRYDVPAIVEHVAEIGGIQNMQQFRIQQPMMPQQAMMGAQLASDEAVEQGVQAGNVVPMSEFRT